jgi:hypothetical protein
VRISRLVVTPEARRFSISGEGPSNVAPKVLIAKWTEKRAGKMADLEKKVQNNFRPAYDQASSAVAAAFKYRKLPRRLSAATISENLFPPTRFPARFSARFAICLYEGE